MGLGRTTQSERASARTAMRGAMLTVVLVVTALVASGCGSSADTAAAKDGPKQHGGQLTVGMDQQPSCLNTWISCGSMAVAFQISAGIWDEMIAINGKGEREPKLVTEVPTTDNGGVVENKNGGMTVTLHIRPETHWSDGRPITCEDVRFTVDTILDERWQIVSRAGYDLITSMSCPDPLTVRYVFKERYAKYLAIVGAAPIPKHVLAGKNFNTFINDRISIASGPFMFDHWDRSVEIVLKRNPDYWNAGADEKPWLDSIRYVFVADTNTLKIQLRTGEVDVINPPPDTSLKDELESLPRGGFEIEPDVYWEQIAFNNAKPPTNDINVRLAIAYSIDRKEITDVVLRKQVGVLQSTILPSQKGVHIPVYDDVMVDPKKVAEYLAKSGYKKSGKYYEKNGKALTVQFKSTAGNILRLKVAQVLQQSLKQNGIKMEILLEPAEVFFGQSTPSGAYNLALWAWSSTLDPSQRTLFSCDMIPTEANDHTGQNYYRYCNEHVTELLKKSDITPDIGERQKIIQQIQREMRADMPVLPIFQRPSAIAYTDRALGLENSPISGFGPSWNTAEWAVAR